MTTQIYQYRCPNDSSIIVYQPYGPQSRITVRPTAVYVGRLLGGWRATVIMPFRQYWWAAANKAHAQRLCKRIAEMLTNVPESEVAAFLKRIELD